MLSVFVPLALAALQAIAQVAVICLFGHILARKGYLNHGVQKGMSILSVKFFTPCLLFANTAASVTRDNFLQFWPVPIYFILFSLAAWLLARLATVPMQLTRSQARFVTATLMFSNTNSLPIGLVQSLALSGAVTWLRWGDSDTAAAVESRGIAYIVFYSLLGNVVRWSYGVMLLNNDLDATADIPVSGASSITLPGNGDAACAAGVRQSNGRLTPSAPMQVTAPTTPKKSTLKRLQAGDYPGIGNGDAENDFDDGDDDDYDGEEYLRGSRRSPRARQYADVREVEDDEADEHTRLLSPPTPRSRQRFRAQSYPDPRFLSSHLSASIIRHNLTTAADESAGDETDGEPPLVETKPILRRNAPENATSPITPGQLSSGAITPVQSDTEMQRPYGSNFGFRRQARRAHPLRSQGAWQGSESDSAEERYQRSIYIDVDDEQYSGCCGCLRMGLARCHYSAYIALRIVRRAYRAVGRRCAPVFYYIQPLLTAPFIAAMLGLVVALTPLRDVLIDPTGALHAVVFSAIRTCGEAAVPVILVCLGAQLTSLANYQPYTADPESAHSRAATDSDAPLLLPASYPSYAHVVPFVVVARLIVLPAVSMLITWFTMPLVGGLSEDPMFMFTVMLLGACPTAVNLMTVCQAQGCFEYPMGRVLMWEYLLSGCTMVGWCVTFLWIAKNVM